ncbi:hypothetical protein QRZ34_28385 [Klebsiella michiganensis]|uniref:hypothetical protein n=1 Tax=Klebsiella michiganensis TaxID=1134687 RepID=UPI0025701AF5|nr:hypothetical protein [Klebsiella michiganensis]MDL4454920.1 hypothetical protein [Klebsiella michiganensis]
MALNIRFTAEVIQLVATLPVLTKITKKLSISVMESSKPRASLWRAVTLMVRRSFAIGFVKSGLNGAG